jgi:hypothetical protein
MDDSSRQAPRGRSGGPGTRFEITIHPTKKIRTLDAVDELDIDRVPDPEGGVRAVVTAEEAARLAERGYEIRLLQPVPVKPLDPSLVTDDAEAQRWLEERVQGIEREEG